IELRREADFAQEAVRGDRDGQLGVQHLDGDLGAARVPGRENRRVAATTHRREPGVAIPQGLADPPDQVASRHGDPSRALATGEARITQGHRLPAKYVIHTVGPVWGGGQRGEPALLRSCYVNALRLAAERGLRSIAFPSISTGAYRYPVERAAEIAVTTVRAALGTATSIALVRFVCFSEADLEVYRRLLGE